MGIISAGGCTGGGGGQSGAGGTSGVAGTTGTAGQTGTAGSTGAAGQSGAAGQTGAAGHDGGAGSSGSGPAGMDGGSPDGAGGTGIVPPTGPCAPPADIYSPIDKLSLTGCMDPVTLTKFVSRAVPYEVNSPLWSDGANKTRAFVLPAGGKIHVKNCAANAGECPSGPADTGRWVFPIGTVMIKNFIFDNKFVETRLFMHMDDGTASGAWVGYSYQWNAAQTEATVTPGDRLATTFNTGTRSVDWHFPSRMDCMTCHTAGGGSTLGPETAQMNRSVGGTNQIDKFQTLGLFDAPPGKPYQAALVAPYPGQAGSPPAIATVDDEARSYLHANCAICHRPNAGNTLGLDLRMGIQLASAGVCNVAVKKPITINGVAQASTRLVPGDPANSSLWQRMHELLPDNGRMPQIGSAVVDADGLKLIGDWITAIKTCP